MKENRICLVCERPKIARGLCNRHYQKLRRYGNPLTGKNLRDRLTKEEIAGIFFLRDEGYRQKDLAEMYGVDQSTISEILSGKRYNEDASI